MLTLTDEAKAKYFKIQASHTAPANSPYSAELIKRRKLEDTKSLEAEISLKLRQKHIKRSGLDIQGSVAGLLNREQNDRRCPDLEAIFAGNLSGSAIPLEIATTGAGVTALDYDPVTKALFYGKHISTLYSDDLSSTFVCMSTYQLFQLFKLVWREEQFEGCALETHSDTIHASVEAFLLLAPHASSPWVTRGMQKLLANNE